MLKLKYLAVAAIAVSLAACSSPEKSIEKDCVRLNLMSEMGGGGDGKKSCACFATKLKDSMSKKDLSSLAKALKQSKTENDFEGKAKENGLSDAAAVTMMGAAKSCAMGT